MKKRQNITTRVLLIAAILVIANVITYTWFFRLDFTKDKRYTLSKATLNILHTLKEPVTVTAYFSENMPPAISQTRSDFKNLLIEYEARSGNKVVFNFINPNKNDTTEQEAQRSGVTPVMLNIRDKDQMKQQRAYLGAVVKMGEKTDVIPFIGPNSAMEYALSSSIKKLSIDKKPVVGLLQGNGEPAVEDLQQVDQALNVLYDFKPVNLSDSAAIPANINTLVLDDPKDSMKPGQLKQLDAFMARGGRLMVAYSGLQGNLQNSSGNALHIGLRKWLAEKDIVLEPKFLIDSHCGSITVRQQEGMLTFDNNVPFPYLPMIHNFSDHPITKNLASVLLPFAANIKFTGDTNKVKYVPLAFTSDKTGLQATPVMFDINHQWTPSEFPFSNLCVAAAFSNIGGNKNARLVVIGNGSFAFNGQGQQAQKQESDNIDLFVNAVDWLSDDTGLIDLRAKEVKPVPLKDLSDTRKVILKYLNFLLPLLLVVLYGIFRFQVRRIKRNQRMEETYE